MEPKPIVSAEKSSVDKQFKNEWTDIDRAESNLVGNGLMITWKSMGSRLRPWREAMRFRKDTMP